MPVKLYIDRQGLLKDVVGESIRVVAFGAQVVEQLVDGNDNEADIAVTASASSALRILNDTENTLIIIMIFGEQEKAGAQSLSEKYKERVKVGDLIESFVPTLLLTIAEKEAQSANPLS